MIQPEHDVELVLQGTGFWHAECSCGWCSVEGYTDMSSAADAGDLHIGG